MAKTRTGKGHECHTALIGALNLVETWYMFIIGYLVVIYFNHSGHGPDRYHC